MKQQSMKKEGKTRARHLIIGTRYGEVMLRESDDKGRLEAYIGDGWDDPVGTVEGSLDDDEKELLRKTEILFQN